MHGNDGPRRYFATRKGEERRAFVLYATRGQTLSKWLAQVAPVGGDPVVQSYAQDRFYNTDLDKILKDKGIKTLILAGWKVAADRLPIRQ